MKFKIISLLAVLFCCSLVASPNRFCDGVLPHTCRAVKQNTQAMAAPDKPAVMMIDNIDELLPIRHYFNNF
jgi:hypothetical protein